MTRRLGRSRRAIQRRTRRAAVTYWVIRRGTGRGSGDYYWFDLGEPHDTARSAWSNQRSDADRFESWEEAQAECCNTGDTCRPVKVTAQCMSQPEVKP